MFSLTFRRRLWYNENSGRRPFSGVLLLRGLPVKRGGFGRRMRPGKPEEQQKNVRRSPTAAAHFFIAEANRSALLVQGGSKMYKTGDMVVYGGVGVCCVESVGKPEHPLPGADRSGCITPCAR